MNYPKISMKAARVNANLTQQQAATALHIDRRSLQDYENGRTVPKWSVVKLMEQIYNFPVDFINFTQKSALSGTERKDADG